MNVPFILCADDFGLTAGISRSILALLADGRLSAAGAMTNRPHWPAFAREFAVFADRADLGLHLNLTCAAPLGPMPRLAPNGTFPPLGALARAALVSAQARAEIAAEIGRQLDAFEDRLGRAPAFVDGHQHAHVLPGIRAALLDAVAARYEAGGVWLRDPADSLAAIGARGVARTKAATIALLATGFSAAAAARGIPVNRGFAGVSPFDPARDFAADLRRFLVRPGPMHLVMCHPGHIDAELEGLDPVVATRPVEHAALSEFSVPPGLRLARFEPALTPPPA